MFFFPIKCLNKERAGGWNCPRKVLQKNPEYSDKYHIKQNKRGRKTVRGIKPDILFLTCQGLSTRLECKPLLKGNLTVTKSMPAFVPWWQASPEETHRLAWGEKTLTHVLRHLCLRHLCHQLKWLTKPLAWCKWNLKSTPLIQLQSPSAPTVFKLTSTLYCDHWVVTSPLAGPIQQIVDREEYRSEGSV